MPIDEINDVDRLKRINDALIARVERSMDQQGNAFTLFQTAINLESRVKAKTDELTQTLRRLELSNRDLSIAKETAETANASKTRFIAAASHDVLQPLNAARLSISALSELMTGAETTKLVRQVERSLDTMEELLRTLLDISRLDAGVMRPEITSVTLGEIFDGLESDFRALADNSGMKFKVRPTPHVVMSDRMMLRRILQNILSNAMRYTRDGGVLIGARKRGNCVLVEIADTGIGIAPDQIETMFDEFHRGPDAAAHHSGGLGLGLSIVRRMTQALDHDLTVRSRINAGTVFRLVLPLSPEQTHLHVQRTEVRGENPVFGLFNANVLLVENDQTVLEATLGLLQRWGCNVRTAASLGDAIAQLSGTGFKPDILIADQHLNRSTLGTDTISHARQLLERTVPAILVTADATPDLAKLTKSSRIELMHKPVRPAELRALMAHLLS